MANMDTLNIKTPPQYPPPPDAAERTSIRARLLLYQPRVDLRFAFATDIEAALASAAGALAIAEPPRGAFLYEYPLTGTFVLTTRPILSLLASTRAALCLHHPSRDDRPPMLAGRDIGALPRNSRNRVQSARTWSMHSRRPAGSASHAIVRNRNAPPQRAFLRTAFVSFPADSFRGRDGRPVCSDIIETHTEVQKCMRLTGTGS